MKTTNTGSQEHLNPTEEDWIALGPVHLFPWLLLLTIFLTDLLFTAVPYAIPGRIAVGWGFTLLRWALGGLAISEALRERSQRAPGSLRGTAFGLAATALGLQVCGRILLPFAPRLGMSVYPMLVGFHGLTTALGFSSLLFLVLGHEEDAGGRFDAAVAAMAFASGLGWLGLPVLAIAAMKGHPLLAAQWQALRAPRADLDGGWFDGLDEALRLKNLGACALLCAVAFLALIGRLCTTFQRAGSLGSNLWWAATDIGAAMLAGLLLGSYVTRKAGGRKVRGPAIAAILIVSLPLLLLLVGAVILVLILTDVIHLRLF